MRNEESGPEKENERRKGRNDDGRKPKIRSGRGRKPTGKHFGTSSEEKHRLTVKKAIRETEETRTGSKGEAVE